jgi:formylglycine-generating enzyme required for sulfatase activity
MPCSHLPPADQPDPLRVDDAHLTETVLLLARGIAADLAFDRLPVLADALEDAGCDNFTLLNHLRSDEPHRVECWALRRLLRTTLVLPGNIPMTFAYCPPGSFLMGSEDPDTPDNEQPAHQVRLTYGFAAAIYPVTQAQWQAVMGENPSEFRGDLRPVERVSWQDVDEFCKRATTLTASPIRLPTEAEWEYACRAGSKTAFHFGDQFIAGVMNHGFDYGVTPGIGRETSDVGRFPPNAWGLFDTHGNVCEWCQDWYSGAFYSLGSRIDPLCTDSRFTRERVHRGGSWSARPEACRSAYRFSAPPVSRDSDLGFRVVFTAT